MGKPNLMKKVQKFISGLEENSGKPLYELTPQQARQVLINVQNIDVYKPEVDIQELDIPLDDDREIHTLIMRPKGNHEKLPIIFYIHGGGWVMGNAETHDRLIRELCVQTPAAVVFPVYSPSPEAQFPYITNDLFHALQFIVKEADNFNLDASKLAVAGDSVGGNMAAVMTLMAKNNEFNPQIDFQLLFYPVTDANFETESYQEFTDGPWLTKKAMEWFWDAYLPDVRQRKDIFAAPLNATLDQLRDLPPALVITDENDVLRDEGEAYAAKLNDAGVEVTSVRFNGTIHDFVMLNALADTAPTKTAIALAITELKKALYK